MLCKNFIIIIITSLVLFACNKLVEVDMPTGKMQRNDVFENDNSAAASVTGLYTRIESQIGTTLYFYMLVGGGPIFGGLSSDELSYTGSETIYPLVEANTLPFNNTYLNTPFWSNAYQGIYNINACLEGLNNSKGLTPSVKGNLLGECYFLRSFYYFHLANMYGDVPMITGTDYNENAVMARTLKSRIDSLILKDLEDAKALMSDDYLQAKRTRINKNAIAAFQARVYLYMGNWEAAEKAATLVINSNAYKLEDHYKDVFLIGSKEAVWQVARRATVGIAIAESYLFTYPSIASFYMTEYMIDAFDKSDRRWRDWVLKKTIGGADYYVPLKYRQGSLSNNPSMPSNSTEDYMMLRFAEQYLIRAEANARLGRAERALSDLDSLRKRAELPYLAPQWQSFTDQEILELIEQERRIELFCEGGHRWFDLKRTPGFVDPTSTRADEVLSVIKPNWTKTAKWFPIPEEQILLNNYLDQNDGYE